MDGSTKNFNEALVKEQLLLDVLKKMDLENVGSFKQSHALSLIRLIQQEVDEDFDCDPKTFTNYFKTIL